MFTVLSSKKSFSRTATDKINCLQNLMEMCYQTLLDRYSILLFFFYCTKIKLLSVYQKIKPIKTFVPKL